MVENALFHGLANEEDGSVRGILKIQVYKNESIHIKVIDNGRGISKNKIQKLLNPDKEKTENRNGHGIGLDNIRERLKILYGDQAELRIYSEPEKWTEMEIVICDHRKDTI